MTAATERIPVLVTPAQKAEIAAKAKAANLSMGEYLRRAAEAFDVSQDDAALDAMLDQVRKSTERASAALDRSLAKVKATERRIADIEARGARQVAARARKRNAG